MYLFCGNCPVDLDTKTQDMNFPPLSPKARKTTPLNILYFEFFTVGINSTYQFDHLSYICVSLEHLVPTFLLWKYSF